MTTTVSDATRDEILRIRRRGAFTPLPLGVAVFVALGLATIAVDEAGVLWAMLLLLGVPLWFSVVRHARVRDAIVLGKGEHAAREYLRGRLATLVKRSARVALVPAIAALGILVISAILFARAGRHPPEPMGAAQYVVVGCAVLGTSLWRGLVEWLSMRRRLAALGGPPDDVARQPWLIDAAREVAATQSDTHAALLWHEATGVRMRDANVAVINLPEPASDAPQDTVAAGPPIDVVRARITGLFRRSIVGNAINITMLAALVALQNSVHGVAASVFWRETFSELTVAQQVCVCLGIITIAGLFALWLHQRTVMKGNEASLRRVLQQTVDQRIARHRGKSRANMIVRIAAVCIVAAAAADAGIALARGNPPWWPIVAEAVLLLMWMVVLPRSTRRRRLEALERLRAELGGPPAAGAAA